MFLLFACRCGKPGHYARECPQSDGSTKQRCFKCDKVGHLARNCTAED